MPRAAGPAQPSIRDDLQTMGRCRGTGGKAAPLSPQGRLGDLDDVLVAIVQRPLPGFFR